MDSNTSWENKLVLYHTIQWIWANANLTDRQKYFTSFMGINIF